MAERITTTYREIEIFYDTNTEQWECFITKGNRWRRSVNLQSVKDFIDKYLDGEDRIKKKAFDKIEVIYFDYYDGGEPENRFITSVIGKEEFWITTKNKDRKKVDSDYDTRRYLENTEGNKAIIKDILEKKKEIEKITKYISGQGNRLKPFDTKPYLESTTA